MSESVVAFPGEWKGSRIRENRLARIAFWASLTVALVALSFVLAAYGAFAVGVGLSLSGTVFVISGLISVGAALILFSKPPQ